MIKNITNKIQENFVYKIIFVIILSIVIPFLIMVNILYSIYFKMVETAAINDSQDQIEYLSSYVDTLFQNIDQSATVFLSESVIRKYMNNNTYSSLDDIEIRENLAEFSYSNVLMKNSYILRDENGKLNIEAAVNQWGDISAEELQNISWYESFKQQKGYYISYTEDFHDNARVIYAKPIYRFSNRDFLGGIVINIETNSIEEVLDDSLDFNEIGLLIDDKGNIIFGTQGIDAEHVAYMANRMSESDVEGYFYDKEYYYFYQNCMLSNVYLMKVVPKTMIVKSVQDTFWAGSFFVFIALGIGMVVLILITRRLVAPIMQMADTLENANPENLQLIEVSSTRDEVGVLQRSYNTMITNYNILLKENYIAVMDKKQAQLKALQFQINPHFVNNTLQMIGSKAIEEDVPEIYRYLKSFSNMFYYCIKNGQDTVTLKEELEYLNDYILLQKARYPERVDVKFRVDDRAYRNPLPKMSLQPILENAFVHGMPKKPDVLTVMIVVVVFENHCTIMIQDDGVGISNEQLEKIKERLNSTNSVEAYDYSGSIGIHNVNTRIKLLYGDEYGCTISSDNGTSIQIKIPLTIK